MPSCSGSGGTSFTPYVAMFERMCSSVSDFWISRAERQVLRVERDRPQLLEVLVEGELQGGVRQRVRARLVDLDL